MTELRFTQVDTQESTRIRVLMPDYLVEMGNYVDVPTDVNGNMVYPYLEHYWQAPDRLPFVLISDEVDCGFALVRSMINPDNGASYHSLAEFFVIPSFRRRGFGALAADMILKSLGGQWEVSVLKTNLPAQKFWARTLTVLCPDLTCTDTGDSHSYRLHV
tara:strand:- start:2718 stop:3197 length:480 start_codon:yes stop_codon:yes gene_type:complete